ncbi:MAG: hypothetical protein HOC71_11450 [Candidatus Latescibacteria bacterium]|mgnify:CR=1 FL=1|nr:hypothetical protein [Candidatus Latescibacterota bacterium]
MKKCPSCGGNVARNANTCPNCGKQFTRPVTMGCAVIVAFFFLAIIYTAICEQVKSPTSTSSRSNSDNYSGV